MRICKYFECPFKCSQRPSLAPAVGEASAVCYAVTTTALITMTTTLVYMTVLLVGRMCVVSAARCVVQQATDATA